MSKLNDLFDQIYLVNLAHHNGRRLKSLAHLESHGITPTVFDATNGYKSPFLDQYNEYAKKRPGSLKRFANYNKLESKRGKLFIESAGAYGYIATYIRILKDAKKNSYQSILILEDDVIVSHDASNVIAAFITGIPYTWKCIHFGASQYNWDGIDIEKASQQGYYHPTQLSTCGSFAMAIRADVFDEIIELQRHFEAPFDHLPMGEIYNRYASDCYVVYPNVIIPDVTSSSIRNSRNQLTHAKQMKWDLRLFDFPLKRPIINLVITSSEQTRYLSQFSDDTDFPFQLLIYIPSSDGLRPYHNVIQVNEMSRLERNPLPPNQGVLITPTSETPVTEKSLLNLYKNLVNSNEVTSDYDLLETQPHEIDPELVSIIIPTYKRSSSLADVITSVVEQDYDPKEIIIVDDNTSGTEERKKTQELVEQLAKAHSETRIIYLPHQKNRNGAAARNTGFLSSTGAYICFLDDDDLFLPGRLSQSISALRNTPTHIGATYCGFIGWNGAQNPERRYQKTNLTKELLSLDYLSHYLHTNTATYKRTAVIALNGFDETFRRHQDLEFNLRFFEKFEMNSVKQQLVSLKPAPTNTNNQQFGIQLFETKKKFLEKFRYIINRFDAPTRQEIYNRHWDEVIRYTANSVKFKQHLLSHHSNGDLQCYARINSKITGSKGVAEPHHSFKHKLRNIHRKNWWQISINLSRLAAKKIRH